MTIYHDGMLEIIGLLEDIVLDEYIVLGINPTSGVSRVYRDFLQRSKYEYRWFGIRSKGEFVGKWNEIRAEMELEDSDFKDTSPSTQITLLTNITQRLKLITKDSLWVNNNWLNIHIADTIRLYATSPDPVEDENNLVMYDAQITTTVSKDDIVDILNHNHWLVVLILLSWISNRSVFEALGHLNYDNTTK